jgi:ubiquitin thioesterase protein OTUB1
VIVASNAFEHEMKDKRAMIDSIADPTVLLPEYKDADSPGFLPGIQYLSTKYQMRRVRGDGNCFYRAFLFAYLEQVLMWHLEGDSTRKENARQEHGRIRSLIVNS